MQLEQFKDEMGYTVEWERFIPQSFFLDQIKDYSLKIKNGANLQKEHYKWAAYRYIIENHDMSSDENWKKFVTLIDSAPNEHLFKGAVSELINAKKIITSQLRQVNCKKFLDYFKVKDLLAKNV